MLPLLLEWGGGAWECPSSGGGAAGWGRQSGSGLLPRSGATTNLAAVEAPEFDAAVPFLRWLSGSDGGPGAASAVEACCWLDASDAEASGVVSAPSIAEISSRSASSTSGSTGVETAVAKSPIPASAGA